MSLLFLFFIFIVSTLAVWVAGIYLGKATDVLEVEWRLGQGLGGMLVLAVVTNLPELTVTVAGAASGYPELAVGNLLGGVALQTMILAALDLRLGKRRASLSSLAASRNTYVEAAVLITLLLLCLVGAWAKLGISFLGVGPIEAILPPIWIAGLFLLKRGKKSKRALHSETALWMFVATAVITLVAGKALTWSGEHLADHFNIGGAVFGASAMALVGALPNLSTGFSAIQLGDYELAYGDIFGGNAFLPVLLPLASLIGGAPVLAKAEPMDLALIGLGLVLTAVFSGGLLLKERRKFFGAGWDSWAAVAVFILGMILIY